MLSKFIDQKYVNAPEVNVVHDLVELVSVLCVDAVLVGAVKVVVGGCGGRVQLLVADAFGRLLFYREYLVHGWVEWKLLIQHLFRVNWFDRRRNVHFVKTC